MGLLVVGAKRHKTTTTIKLPDLQGGPHNISAVFQKCKRLGLRTCCCAKPTEKHTTTSVPLSKDLPTHEQALKILAGANQKGRWELLLVSEKIKKTTTMP